jgi:glycosyltransferase involved in cell wall biosynthesis
MPRQTGADEVTVVVATLGRSPFLAAAVASALAERPREVVIVQDGPGRLELGADAGIRLLRLDAVGRSSARNAGVEAAMTPFIAFLDDDDLILPGRLERQRASLLAAPQSPLSFGRVRVVDADGQVVGDWTARLDRRFSHTPENGVRFSELLAERAPLYTSATMVRRELFLEAGGYDRQLEAYEDLDLYLRLSRLGPLVPSPGEPVAAYRLHGSNTPSPRLYEGALEVAAKHLPVARGRERRVLQEWRIDALWGLERFREVRREAAGALLRDPALAFRPRFAKRALGAALPARFLDARR